MESVLLYHEKQEGKLCAVHCLNAVLQGPYFSELELAQIGRELDQTERDMMLENGDQSADYLRFVSEGSSNVAMDGNFSIQVLEKALSALDLRCVPLNSSELEGALDLHKQDAFICNLSEHWFAIRKVGNEWYNFNSLLAAPQHLSSFYLSAYLDTLKNDGWSMFVVQGQLPRDYNSTGNCDEGVGFGRWYTPEEAEAVLQLDSAEKESDKQKAHDDPELEAAIKASLNDMDGVSSSSKDDEEQDLARALAASLADVKQPM